MILTKEEAAGRKRGSMNEETVFQECSNCIHAEMCRWINEMQWQGCSFWDEDRLEEANKIIQAAEDLKGFAETGITTQNLEKADEALKTIFNAKFRNLSSK